jgi:uncharacterized membrane protein
MNKGRLEAFSKGVIAIINAVMMIKLIKVPQTADLAVPQPINFVFLSHALSFLYCGIYWTNYHHMFQAVKRIDGRVLWANLHLLFWLSFVPFTTAWMGENAFSAGPVALYGIILLLAAIAYFMLTRALIALHAKNSVLATAIGHDRTWGLSLVMYLVALCLAFVNAWFACGLYVMVAIIWLIPNQRIERTPRK